MSRSRLSFGSSIALATLLVHLAGPVPAQAETVRCAGGETGIILVDHLHEAFSRYSGLDLESSGTGNQQALTLLAQGTIAFAVTCGPHQELLGRAGIDPAVAVNWISVPAARDPFIVVVNPANGVQGLTVEELVGLFRGRYSRWTELGGADLPIIPVILGQAADCGMVADFLETAGGGEGVLSARAKRMRSPSQLGHFTRATAGAVTFMGFNSYDPVYGEMVKIGGVKPDWDSFQTGRYPLSVTHHITFDRTRGDQAREFLDFMGTLEGAALINQVMVAVPQRGGGLP